MSRSSYVSEPKELSQHAIEQGYLCLAAVEADGRYLAVNAARPAMDGGSEADLLGKHWEVTVRPQDRRRTGEEYRLAGSSARGDVGCTAEIGGGSFCMIAEISDAWLAPEKAFLPVAIS